jgi:hypothetical protein
VPVEVEKGIVADVEDVLGAPAVDSRHWQAVEQYQRCVSPDIPWHNGVRVEQ